MSTDVNKEQMESSRDEQLKSLFSVSNSLVSCTTREAVAEEAIKLALEKLSSQSASVFLFTKDGYLKRLRISGTDANGHTIPNDWFSEEKHVPGQSFTGRVVVRQQDSRYGRPYWTKTLSTDQIDPESRNNYVEKLGALHDAVAVPLNGRHRTFGVLEVINKFDGKRPLEEFFSDDDMYWLSIIGMTLSTVLSRLRSNEEFKLLADMSKMLVEPFSIESQEKFDAGPFYKHTVQKLIGPTTCYRVCFLRVVNADQHLEIAAQDGDSIRWTDGDRVSLKVHEHIAKGEGFAGKVYESGEQILIKNLEARAEEFQNAPWIKLNNLKSYACFPLLIKERAVGTLSLYTGFVHDFDESDIEFLQNISFLIAAFTESVRVIRELNDTRQQLQDEFQKILRGVREIGYEKLIDQFLHVYKNELVNLHKAFELYDASRSGKKDEIIETQTSIIQKRIAQITNEFSTTAPTRISINNLIKEVVRYFELNLKGKNVTIEVDYGQLPQIMAKEFQIRELIRNLLDNAVKAIEKIHRKEGLIIVKTCVQDYKRIEYIEITVEDNGIGIDSKNKQAIYERGFSTYDSGTGMGLFDVANVVQSYGGSVEHVSTVGKGSEFTVIIPIQRHRTRGD